MHAIDTLYQEHLARRELPPRDLIEQHTRCISDEHLAGAIAGRLACALPSAEALDSLPPSGAVAYGSGWRRLLGLLPASSPRHRAVATDLFAPEDNPRFRRPGWYLVQPMDVLAALCRYPDHDLLAVCLPPGLSLQQVYEAVP